MRSAGPASASSRTFHLDFVCADGFFSWLLCSSAVCSLLGQPRARKLTPLLCRRTRRIKAYWWPPILTSPPNATETNSASTLRTMPASWRWKSTFATKTTSPSGSTWTPISLRFICTRRIPAKTRPALARRGRRPRTPPQRRQGPEGPAATVPLPGRMPEDGQRQRLGRTLRRAALCCPEQRCSPAERHRSRFFLLRHRPSLRLAFERPLRTPGPGLHARQ